MKETKVVSILYSLTAVYLGGERNTVPNSQSEHLLNGEIDFIVINYSISQP